MEATFKTSDSHLPAHTSTPLTHFFLKKIYACPGTMTTHAESINSDLQRGLDRRLRHTRTLNTEQNQFAIKVSADN